MVEKKKETKSTAKKPAKASAKPAAKKIKSESAAPKAAPKAPAKVTELPVFDLKGKTVENLSLDPLFGDAEINNAVIYQAVLMYRAGEREGTASTKDRGHVRGGGKKPWRQKGTGQARHGSRRSPIWRGGGVTFGPQPRDYSYTLPQQLRRRAVVETMKQKVQNGKLVVLSRLELDAPKTKLMNGILGTFKLNKPVFVVEQKSANLLLASRNIPGISLKTAQEINALDVISHHECVMTKAAYNGLLKRLKA